MNSILGVKVIEDYIRMCHDGVRQGWHERNGGNLMYRMRAEGVEECRPYFRAEPGPWVEIGVMADNLKKEYFISTSSGKFLQNVGLKLRTASVLWRSMKPAMRIVLSGDWKTAAGRSGR